MNPIRRTSRSLALALVIALALAGLTAGALAAAAPPAPEATANGSRSCTVDVGWFSCAFGGADVLTWSTPWTNHATQATIQLDAGGEGVLQLTVLDSVGQPVLSQHVVVEGGVDDSWVTAPGAVGPWHVSLTGPYSGGISLQGSSYPSTSSGQVSS